MAFTQAKLIFGTDHAMAFFAAYFSFLDLECVAFFIIKCSAYSCHWYFLPCSHVWSATNYLYRRVAIAKVYSSYSQSVSIRVLHAGKYMANNNTFKPSFERLKFFYSLNLQAKIGKKCSRFFRFPVKFYKLF